MQKFIISTSTILTLLLSGCGSSEDTSCRLNVQRNMDKANYDAVIEELDQASCQKEYDGDEFRITLAAAYMNKSGLNFTSIIESTTNSSGDFASFAQNIEENSNPGARANLDRAKREYEKYLDGTECIDLSTLESTDSLKNGKKDVCLFKSLTEAILATKNITVLAGNIQAWLDPNQELNASDDLNQDDIPDEVNANSCSLKYTQDLDCSVTIDGTPMKETITLKTIDSNLVINDKPFELIESGVTDAAAQKDPNTFVSLIYYPDDNNLSDKYKVLTEGFCKTDMTPCDDDAKEYIPNSCYPCPEFDIDSKKPLNYNASLVENLNDGLDGTSSIVSDQSVKDSIDKFKQDFTENNSTKKLAITNVITFLDTPKKTKR